MAFTFFFRDIHTIELMVSYVVPFVSGRSVVRIWDAGCAMGPELYTIAIAFAEKMGYFAFKGLKIDASDLDENDTFGKIVMNGIYSSDELARIPRDIFEKYFQPADADGFHKIIDPLRNRINFYKHDLLSLKPVGSEYALVICKNVLLHFTHQERVNVIRMFHDSLCSGGYLVMEQTQPLPSELESCFEKVVTDAQLYKKRS
ncbi:MAG: chemotaxis protein CheR [Candidatus Riflebacteria bacterium]|nr:chemotaxis protein CheR [Candidatus Riflebacteria bacterium]